MLNEIGKKWVEALRSGKYKQGKDALCIEEHYCCLGVLCEVAIESGLPVTKRADPEATFYTQYEGTSSYLPDPVQRWAGLTSNSGVFRKPVGEMYSLAGMNDLGKSFEEIAQTIEEHAEELGLA